MAYFFHFKLSDIDGFRSLNSHWFAIDHQSNDDCDRNPNNTVTIGANQRSWTSARRFANNNNTLNSGQNHILSVSYHSNDKLVEDRSKHGKTNKSIDDTVHSIGNHGDSNVSLMDHLRDE